MVQKVFGTLLKVPCYIVIGYLVMNIALFLGYYVKALGLSYSVMQVAVENNYIPENEEGILTRTMNSLGSRVVYDGTQDDGTLHISAVSDFGFYIDTSGSTSDVDLYPDAGEAGDRFANGSRKTAASINSRRQYGNEITVGVGYIYHAVLPLPKRDDNRREYSDKINGSANIFEYNTSFADTAVRITYKVPGLKYYPDL